ncbi:hypothetical protein Pmani_010575 [Petrolisthes manimaculis]|uniref:Uncharacterized protein n=1 Tax=Petrolisthes manimaculis TaxID=1843537 RepID=A0AAE1UH63_9EUCA|nr:hypothetical protein Pmani_010575 [Petrolisthes manimaculis]
MKVLKEVHCGQRNGPTKRKGKGGRAKKRKEERAWGEREKRNRLGEREGRGRGQGVREPSGEIKRSHLAPHQDYRPSPQWLTGGGKKQGQVLRRDRDVEERDRDVEERDRDVEERDRDVEERQRFKGETEM